MAYAGEQDSTAAATDSTDEEAAATGADADEATLPARSKQHLMLNKKLPTQLHMKKKIEFSRPLYPLWRGYQRLTLSPETLLLQSWTDGLS